MWLRLVSLNKLVFFFFVFQAEDGIRDVAVTGVQTCALFFQAEDGIRDVAVTGVQTCALPISKASKRRFENWQRRVVPSPGVTSHLTLELIRGGSPSTVCGETQPRSAIVTTT